MSAAALNGGTGVAPAWKNFAIAVLVPIAMAAAGLLLFEWLNGAGVLPRSVPAPSQVWAKFMGNPVIIVRAVLDTGGKALLGYGVAMLVALFAASVATLLPPLRGPVYNFGVGLYSVPLIATVPLLALWLGTGSVAQTVIAGLACYFPMLVGAMQGFRAYEAASMELFHVYNASRWQILRYLVLPSSLPYLFAGFKLAAPVAVLGALTAEWAGAESGIGAILLGALFTYDTAMVWLTVLSSCLLAGAGYGVGAFCERIVGRWGADVTLQT